MFELDARAGDDRRFLRIVERVVEAAPKSIRELWATRIDNWFDHKWLRFSGMGRVPFDDPRPSHPGVALDPFSQEKLTFPPFSPKRILEQTLWTLDASGPARWIHARVREHSAANLHRRVENFSDSMVAVWFSSRTEDNRQGSLMQHTSQNGSVDAWYISLRLEQFDWRLVRTKGIAREQANALVVTDDPPASEVTQRR